MKQDGGDTKRLEILGNNSWTSTYHQKAKNNNKAIVKSNTRGLGPRLIKDDIITEIMWAQACF